MSQTTKKIFFFLIKLQCIKKSVNQSKLTFNHGIIKFCSDQFLFNQVPKLNLDKNHGIFYYTPFLQCKYTLFIAKFSINISRSLTIPTAVTQNNCKFCKANASTSKRKRIVPWLHIRKLRSFFLTWQWGSIQFDKKIPS